MEEKGYTKVRSENKYFLKLEEVTSQEENKDLSQDELKKIAKEELKAERKLRNRKEINKELFEVKKSEIKDRLVSNHLRSKEIYQNKGNQSELEKLENRLQKVTYSKEEFLKKYRTDENVLK